jgi:CBS domain-containing protein
METIKELLKAKGDTVWTIQANASVFDALKSMAEKEVGALVVLDGRSIVGMVSERDYARNVALKGRVSTETPVRDIMTTRVVCVRPDQSVDEGMALITDKRVRHLPVIENDALVGIVSIGDLVKATIETQQFVIAQLENYISS